MNKMESTEKMETELERRNKNLLSLGISLALNGPLLIYMFLPQMAKEALQSAIAIRVTNTWQIFAIIAVPVATFYAVFLETKRNPQLKQSFRIIYWLLPFGLAIVWAMTCAEYSFRNTESYRNTELWQKRSAEE